MTLTHAVVEVVQAAAVDASRGLPSQFPVQFNPTQITLQRAAEYSETKEAGMPMPVLQVAAPQAGTLWRPPPCPWSCSSTPPNTAWAATPSTSAA